MPYIGFKTRINLNNAQTDAFVRWAHSRRYAYNWALNICTIMRDQADGRLELKQLNEIDKWFNAGKYPLNFVRKTKSDTPLIGSGLHEWLRTEKIPGSVCQTAIKTDLKHSWERFFKKVSSAPTFQKRHRRLSFSLSNTDLKLANIGKKVRLPNGLGYAKLSDLPPWFTEITKLSQSSFTQHAGKWYASFIFEVPDSTYYIATQGKQAEVGVDLGVAKYAALSNGEDFAFPKQRLIALQKKIAALEAGLSKHLIRKGRAITRACSNAPCHDRPFMGLNEVRYYCADCREAIRRKGKQEVKLRSHIAKLKAKQGFVRNDAAEHLSSKLAKGYDLVVMEDLSVSKMTKSSKGTIESPGTNVKQKSGLNRELLNVSPYSLKLKTQYKTVRHGGQFIAIDPRYTSQTCAECGHIDKESRQSQALFKCTHCGHHANADSNAAINILNKGKELLTQSGKVDAR